MRTHGLFVLAPLAFSLLTGCGATAASSKPAQIFPSRAEIAAIPSAKPPASAFATDAVKVDAWSFEAAPAESPNADYDDASPWGGLLREVIAPRAAEITLSSPLRCAAAEIARFRVQKKGTPVESLRRFIVARCGGIDSSATAAVWSATAPASASDAEVFAQLSPDMRKRLADAIPAGRRSVGLAMHREGDDVTLVAMIGDDDVRFEDGFSRKADASRRVTLRGTYVGGEAAEIMGWINEGDNGVAACSSDPRVRAPKFAITCRLAPGDKAAWVELVARQTGRLLLTAISDVLVHTGDLSAVTYRARTFGPPAEATSATALAKSIAERVNGVRKAAKLAPLTVAARQSAENTRLVGALVQAATTRQNAISEKIAIGLIAGWDVEGTIRKGDFFVGHVGATRDVNAWLDFALESPLGRLTLLDPESRQIAIGGLVPEGVEAIGAAVTTYSLFESSDHSADEAKLRARIATARDSLGVTPAVQAGSADLRAAAQDILVEGKAPLAALQSALDSIAGKTGTASQGWVAEGTDLDQLAIPEELLKEGPMQVAVAVTHHRAEGAAWGQYVAIFVAVQAAGVR